MTQTPFTKKETVDKPAIIGARWWQEAVADPIPRRQAAVGLLALGGVLAAMATIGTCAAIAGSGSDSGSSDSDVLFQPRSALDMQREYGWSFGATSENLVFNGESTQPFDRSQLAHIDRDCGPSDPRWFPFYAPTLFQSLEAIPNSTPAGDPASITSLKDAIRPIHTVSMDDAFRRGKAVAMLFEADKKRALDTAVVVDMPGPEAVAFAAGAAHTLDPVFLFDNWPHPRGVVPAHRTLAAAAYFQPLFVRMSASRPKASPAMFVLDRSRLATYTDDATQFDNRYAARLPSAAALTPHGIKNILYVSLDEPTELDDLNDDFTSYPLNQITLRLVPSVMFRPGAELPAPAPDGGVVDPPYYYGGEAGSHASFWTAHPVYVARPRKTPFSSGTPSRAPDATSRPRPTNFGMVAVAVAAGTGAILGAKLSRSGSWNRTGSSSSGS